MEHQSGEAKPRDAGASDEVWYQLQEEKAAAVAIGQEIGNAKG